MKTRALFVLKKTLQAQQKRRENEEHQQKMFTNGKQTQNKPQKPERAPKRQNSTATKIFKKFRFQFLKKNKSIKF